MRGLEGERVRGPECSNVGIKKCRTWVVLCYTVVKP